MGILKKVDSGIKKAEKKYKQLERESRPIRKAGAGAVKAGIRVLDWIMPPPKKKGAKAGKTVKIGECTCTRPEKKKR
ncbi:MAG: hypothetical protein Q8M94_12205 [Ignavibacteria bacterium]|nr:hypothetical protein [Ignavibacteria bacterium]